MRSIGFISSNEYVPWGGSEYCWAAAAEKLARAGVEVRLSVRAWDQPVKQVEHLRSIGCRVFYRPMPTLLRRASRRLFSFYDYPRRHLQAVGAGADLLVICQGGNTDGFQWMEAAKSHGYKYAVTVEGAPDNGWPADDVVERLADCYESAAAVYFVCEANAAFTRRQFATPLRHARLIRNPFNVRYDARPPWPEDSSGILSLACVARLDIATKRHDLFCQVLDLPHWRDRNVRISVFGDGPNRGALQRLIESLKLTNIRLAGTTDDIEEVWRTHHALVLPSRHEGMPLVVVEAMLCGRPCIVTDVGGNRELVRDGVNGFLAKAPTVEFLDEAMNRAWENRHRLREMGEQAAVDVRQWVSPDPTQDFVRQLEELLPGASLEAAAIGTCLPSPR